MNYYEIKIIDYFGFTTKVFAKTPCRLHNSVINKKFDLSSNVLLTSAFISTL